MIERKRRERINDSLNQLKALVLDALKKDVSIDKYRVTIGLLVKQIDIVCPWHSL